MSSFETTTELGHVAVIGMSGRFPGSPSVAALWESLCRGAEHVTFFGEEELLAAGVTRDALADPAYVRAKGVVEGADLFDAQLFGFSPREAEITDPQQRIFLECAWEALEDAGYDPESFGGQVGVYAGVGWNGYVRYLYAVPGLVESVGGFRALIGNDKDHLATHASYKLNLKGPSVTVQTACSTSLVAVHMACQSLLGHECDIALAGGAAIDVPQRAGYFYREGGILSPDGHCRAFDAKAQGTVGGSGVGIVVLKRLSDALEDGDRVYAVIRGSAVNNDGSAKVGYTAPGVEGQARVIAEAQMVAGVEPETITYVEAHGTGTPLGDPVEIEALTKAFRAGTDRRQFCAIGSLKTNIGHLDTASGVAGLIKTALALTHKALPPSLHYQSPNPQINFEESPFFVNTRLTGWESNGTPRRAGVSSFGIGGTNAHVILEEPPELPASDPAASHQLLLLSAKTGSALKTMSENLARHLRSHPDLNLADVAYTLQLGRRSLGHRLALVARDCADAAEALESQDRRVEVGLHEPGHRSLTFMFPGQGTQYVGMGRGLYETCDPFRDHAERALKLFEPHLGAELGAALYPPRGLAAEGATPLDQTRLTQPALFVVEYALAQTLIGWGLEPDAMIGHSVGEYVAACLAGVFVPEEAAAVVAARARLMQAMEPGAMLAVGLSEPALCDLLPPELSLAAVNAPELCVASGPAAAIEDFASGLEGRGVNCRRLRTSHAFHSALTEPMLEDFAGVFEGIRLKAPRVPYISNLTGTWITEAEATDPAYWVAHLRRTVRFSEGARELLKEPGRVMLEVGPGRTLCGLVGGVAGAGARRAVMPCLDNQSGRRPDAEVLMRALGGLWLSGVGTDWRSLHAGRSRRRVSLPTYPFERRRYWVEPPQAPTRRDDADATRPGSDAAGAHELEAIIARQLELIAQQVELISSGGDEW